MDMIHEAAVNLDFVNCKTLKLSETRISGSEIIHRNLYSTLVPLIEKLIVLRIILKLYAFYCAKLYFPFYHFPIPNLLLPFFISYPDRQDANSDNQQDNRYHPRKYAFIHRLF